MDFYIKNTNILSKILLSILILTVFSEFGFSQTKTIKIKDSNLKNTWEEISVLKSNNEIREGAFKRIVSGELAVEGNYKNGQKIGIWKIYSYAHKVETEINYDNGRIKYVTRDTLTKTDIIKESSLTTDKNRPLLNIAGSNVMLNYMKHSLIYPESAMKKGISGIVVVAVEVNAEGEITGYRVKTSIDKSLDEEALRVIKKIPLEFLPEIKDGVAVNAEMLIRVSFTLN